MAQTGYTPISIFYSATGGNTPTSGNLVAGELAINTADGKLFYKDAAGVVQVIAGKGGAGVAGGSNTQVQYNSSGSLAGSSNMTFNGTTLTLANDASISGLTVGKGGGSVSSNTVFGNNALNVNSSGSSNSAFGINVLSSNTTGLSNSGFGVNTLIYNTTGGFNTAYGQGSLQNNTTASNNTAVGYQAGYANTTGAQNAYFGKDAGKSVTTGNWNTFIGVQAGLASTGTQNTFVGASGNGGAGYLMTTGNSNAILGGFSGNQGGLDIRTASNYIVLSDGDGNPRAYCNGNGTWSISGSPGSGIRNVQITNTLNASNSQGLAVNLGTGTNDTSSYIFIGSGAGADRMYVFGNGNIVNTNNSYGTLSDIKLKENIVDATPKLANVMQLQVRNFNLKSDPDHKQIGFVAQELEQVFPAMIDESPDIDSEGNDLGTVTKSIKTSVLVPILVKAIQEQQALIVSMQARLDKAGL